MVPSDSQVNPPPPQGVAEDLAFIAAALKRRETDVTSWPIAMYWALYTVVGFTLIDFMPRYGGFWFVGMGVVGALFSVWCGCQSERTSGLFDAQKGWRYLLHWGSIVLGIAGVAGIVIGRGVDVMIASQMIVLVVGMIYFLAGVHFDRRYLPLGLLLVAGSVVTGLLGTGVWTTLGVLLAIGLVLLAVVARRTVSGALA